MASLKRDPSGDYVVRFYVAGRGSRKVYRNLGRVPYAEAVKRAAAVIAEEKLRKAGDPGLTFAAVAREYVKTHGPQMAENSRKRVEETLRLHLLPVFGALKVEALRPLDVERYRQARLEAGAKPATVNREWSILKAALNRAEAWGLIDRNPLRRGAVKVLRVEPSRLIFFEPEEWRRFVEAFHDEEGWRRHLGAVRVLGPVRIGAGSPEPRRYGAGRNPDSEASAEYLARLRATLPVFEALLLTGSRLGEILALSWEDVDLGRGLISIRQSKTGRTKTVPVSKDLEAVLRSLPRGIGEAPVFTRPGGARFYRMEVQRAFAVAKRLSGIRPELTVHTLRHTFASWLASEGTPLRTIQELLGHADVRMTIRYAHLAPAHLREAVETIGAVLRDRTPIRGRTVDETGVLGGRT